MITEHAHQLLNDLEQGTGNASAFYTCRQLADHTRQLISQRRKADVMTCMARMLDIYHTTRAVVVRTAIENSFLYSLGNHLISRDQREYLDSVLPEDFAHLLKEQIIHSGI